MLEALIAIALAGQQLDAADDANLALTTCAWEAYRHANERDQPLDEFARTLSSRCSGEIAQMRRTVVELEISRGKGRAEAAAKADSLIAGFHAHFARHYARRAETEAQLRAFERALREEGIVNAQ